MRFSSDRKREVIERRTARLPELIDVLNDLFDAANRKLLEKTGQEWLFLGEDFEKLLDARLPEVFFVRESAVFSGLRTHLVFTIPVDLGWSNSRVALPFPVYSILDCPVYTDDLQPDQGRTVLRDLLAKRIDPDRFEPGQLDRLIVASGGHLRDLFDLVREASDRAIDEEPSPASIREGHVSGAIAKMRREVVMRLGDSPYDPDPIPWKQRAERLVSIHRRDPGSDIPDAALHSLVRIRAVQEFNGEGRFAVSPLVVDILIKEGLLLTGSSGGLLPASGS